MFYLAELVIEKKSTEFEVWSEHFFINLPCWTQNLLLRSIFHISNFICRKFCSLDVPLIIILLCIQFRNTMKKHVKKILPTWFIWNITILKNGYFLNFLFWPFLGNSKCLVPVVFTNFFCDRSSQWNANYHLSPHFEKSLWHSKNIVFNKLYFALF